MAYNQQLADRIRKILKRRKGYNEKNMFGGICFLLRGNMCCGVEKNRLMLRVGIDQYEECLELPQTSKMDFTGKPLKGFIYVSAKGVEKDENLKEWIERGLKFIKTLPSK